MTHKWLSPRMFVELKRAYRGGMTYKAMSHRFDMTNNQISWYLRDVPKRQKHMARRVAKVVNPPTVSVKQMAAYHAIAKRSLREEIEQAKKERATAPLYRPTPDKVWE
jgi:hypothetical protein